MVQERPQAAEGRGRVQGSLMAGTSVHSDGEALGAEDSGEVEMFTAKRDHRVNNMEMDGPGDGPGDDFLAGISDGDDGSFDDGIDDEF